MSFLAKQRLSYYKKYKLDIWGFLHNTLQVLEDNTLYKVHNIFKYNRKLTTRWKEINWEYGKYHKQVFLELFKIHKRRIRRKITRDEAIINLEQLKESHSYKNLDRMTQLRYKIFLENILAYNLWNVFIKQTISKRLSNIFNVLLTTKSDRMKIYFRRPFIYEPRVSMSSKRRRKINEQFISSGIVKLFYVMYNYRQLKKIAIKAKLQNGVLEHNYLSIIESKLPSYIYRISFFPTIFESLDFVKNGNVWVNKEYKPFIYYNIQLFDFVGFRPVYKSYIVWSFFKRLRRRAFLFMFPKCIYVSLAFLFVILIKRIKYTDIINTFNFDYYRIVNYLK